MTLNETATEKFKEIEKEISGVIQKALAEAEGK